MKEWTGFRMNGISPPDTSMNDIFCVVIVNGVQTLRIVAKNVITQVVGIRDTSRYSYTCYYIKLYMLLESPYMALPGLISLHT